MVPPVTQKMRLPENIIQFLDMDSTAAMASVDRHHRELVLSSLSHGETINRISFSPDGMTFGVIIPNGYMCQVMYQYKSPSHPIGIIIQPIMMPRHRLWHGGYTRWVYYITSNTIGPVFGEFTDGFVKFPGIGISRRLKKV